MPVRALPVAALAVLPLVGLLEARTPSASEPSTVDSARAEFEAGRTWHAARLLAPLHTAGELADGDVLLLARARAGYRDWPGVVAVLEGAEWLDRVEGGAGWFVLGRALEAQGVARGAAAAYSRVVDEGLEAGVHPSAVRARLARVRWASGDTAGAFAALDDVDDGAVRSWMAWELAQGAVEAGRTERVVQLLERIDDEDARSRAWDARERALLAAGDTVAAAAGYTPVVQDGADAAPERRARAWRVAGDLAYGRDDRPAALEAYGAALADARVGSDDGARAAARLLELDPDMDAATLLHLARHLDRGGTGSDALTAYDRYVAAARAEGTEPEAWARLERARLMSTVAARQEAAIDEWRELGTHPDPEIGARTLTLWAALRRSQGRTGDYQTLRRWLVERYPNTSEAAAVVFFRGDAAHDQQRWDAAVAAYDEVARMAPAVDYAGLARMRAGQIHLHRGDLAAARAVFEGYLRDFPTGRRWEEASYWAARAHWEAGDSTAGLALLGRLRAEEPFSYYSVLTADLLGEPYRVDLPPGPTPRPPSWVEPALQGMDRLTDAGLPAAADAMASALGRRAESEGPEALMALAEGFNARNRTLTGINLGWAARREGVEWSDRLVRIVYPFPYQELVLREAREVGVDPLLLAALIRQESAFVPDIVSSAGAVGLMQVMPATGRDLARNQGVDNFTTETLESPEINLHLGARFLIDQLERYGPDLPLVLSAYNAGPARANRWRTFPEAADLLRLTERIPFSETRGYVKNVTRNRRLYEALYGSDLDARGR